MNHNEIDIHNYPDQASPQELLAYRIAVMQAYKAGAAVEFRLIYGSCG